MESIDSTRNKYNEIICKLKSLLLMLPIKRFSEMQASVDKIVQVKINVIYSRTSSEQLHRF